MTLTDLDISSFNYPELNELKAKIETRIVVDRDRVCACTRNASRQVFAA